MLFGREEKKIGLTSKDLEKCPICKTFVSLAEEAACLILKKSNPDLDVEACKAILRMKLQGKPVDEIAKNLHVPKETLLKVIDQSTEMASQTLKQIKK